MSTDSKFDIDVDAVSHDELKQAYKRLRDSRISARQENQRLAKWAGALSEAVSKLAYDGSLAFQAMAEKAGVRGHPSVSKVVELFDMIGHPQWRDHGKPFPKVEFPDDWDLEPKDVWSGDADMQLNAPVAETIEILESLKWSKSASSREWNAIEMAKGMLHVAALRGLEGVKEARGFKPRHLAVPEKSYFRDMDRDELEELVSALGWMALDLAQDMDAANSWLRRDLRAATYRRVGGDLYQMSQFAVEPAKAEGGIDIKIFGDEVPA